MKNVNERCVFILKFELKLTKKRQYFFEYFCLAHSLGGKTGNTKPNSSRADCSSRVQFALHSGLLRCIQHGRRNKHMHGVHGRRFVGLSPKKSQPHTGAHIGQDHRGRAQGSQILARVTSNYSSRYFFILS